MRAGRANINLLKNMKTNSKRATIRKPLVAITIGDMNGIGPEIGIRAVLNPGVRKVCRPVLVGSSVVYSAYARMLRFPIRISPIRHLWQIGSTQGIPVLEVRAPEPLLPTPGRLSKESGAFAAASLREATMRCTRHEFAAVVTAPISKEALSMAGYSFPGQTEFLAHLTHSPHVVMMFVSDAMRVALATVHLPLSAVPRLLTGRLLTERLTTVIRSLRRDFGVASPRIAVLGLNPHAGEHGLLGKEEEKILRPFIRKFQGRNAVIEGPFPPDAFWGMRREKEYDAVFAMYHDQGLIPFKMLSFSDGVNYSAGLSIVRTSPDHGTAFDIAGTGRADSSSMIAAIRRAVSIAHTRMSKLP
jgi:4-hydroxythreonine-4-phosphate dehydrogenase